MKDGGGDEKGEWRGWSRPPPPPLPPRRSAVVRPSRASRSTAAWLGPGLGLALGLRLALGSR